MRKSVGQAPTEGEKLNKIRIGRLPTSEQNWKIILSDEVRCRIGKDECIEIKFAYAPPYVCKACTGENFFYFKTNKLLTHAINLRAATQNITIVKLTRVPYWKMFKENLNSLTRCAFRVM
jgi:hypothetical protein